MTCHLQVRQPPFAQTQARALTGQQQRQLLHLPHALQIPSPEVRDRLHSAHTRKTSMPAVAAFTAATVDPTHPGCPPPPIKVPVSATAMSFLPAKNLIFQQDKHNNFRCLVDSSASLSIFASHRHSATTGQHLVGGKRQDHFGGDFAVLPSAFLVKILNSIFYLQPLLPLCLARIF